LQIHETVTPQPLNVRTSKPVSDCPQVDVSKASNALDRWIAASARSLTTFVRQEMSAYRLYTVVPRLVKFIGDLTNVYVRYNRKRLKGGKSRQDCLLALASLYRVLLTLCKVSESAKLRKKPEGNWARGVG